MDMSQYLEIFIEETKEHLQNLNQNLLLLEKSPNEMTTLNEIFRAAHTLKGIAGTMGFTKIAGLTHDMESVLQTVRNGELSVTSSVVDLLFRCLDALEGYLNEIIATGSEGSKDCDEIVQALKDIIEKKSKSKEKTEKKADASKKTHQDKKRNEPKEQQTPQEQKVVEEGEESLSAILINDSLKEIIKGGLDKIEKAQEVEAEVKSAPHEVKDEAKISPNYTIRVKLNEGCLLKAARSYIVFQTLEKYAQIIRSNPDIKEIEEEKFDFEFTIDVFSKESKELLIKEINSIAEVDEVVIEGNGVESNNDEEPQSPKSSDAVSAASQGTSAFAAKSRLREKSGIDTVIERSTPTSVSKSKPGKTVRVDIDRLDTLMNLVSELIIIKTTLEGAAASEHSQNYGETIEYLERITTNLHDAVMKVRMVPVEMVFNRFPRMIRDLSKELGKEMVLNMSGETTEVDRTVIDEIGDPLIHLLRNSADHGIEEPSKRSVLGKSEQGTIELRAYQDGNSVVIEVEDDGAGINIEKVRRKLVEKGLATPDTAANLADSEIIDYLFKPSFSTADKITDVSGRGVGLDVVKTKIEALGGVIEVKTEFGIGSKFIIRFPLTLAIIQALLVNLAEEKYAIPLSSIKEIINISLDEIKVVRNQEVYMLREQLIPIIRLKKVLQVPVDEQQEPSIATVVVVKKGEKLIGFVVDSLIGQQEIVIKSLGKYLGGIRSIAGATILGNGQVALILDTNSLG